MLFPLVSEHILNWLSILDQNVWEGGGGGEGEAERKVQKIFPIAKSVCESSLREGF